VTRIHSEHDGECRDSSVCDRARTRTVHRALVDGARVIPCRGDIRRTDLMARAGADSQIRFAAQAFLLEDV
jgi:hypothetical protein